MKRPGTLMTLALLAVLSGCATGQGGLAAPDLPKSDHYSSVSTNGQTVIADGISQQIVQGQPLIAAWWKQYQSDALNDLVDEGMRNSPDVAAASLRLQSAKEQLHVQTGNSTMPKVDFVAQGERQRALGLPNLGPAFSTELYDSFVGQLQANYMIDIFGAVRHANAALAQRYEAQGYQYEAAQRAVVQNIVAAVVTVATLHDAVDSTTQMVELSEQQAGDARRRFALGAIGQEELLMEEGNAEAIKANLPALQMQLASARHALAVLLGRAPSDAPIDLRLSELHLPEQIPVVVPSELLRNRPDIRAAEALLHAAAEDYDTATAQMYPQLNLTASLGRGGFEWGPSMSTLWGAGASLVAPVFHGGALNANQRAAESLYAATAVEYKKTVLAAFQETANALVALETDALQLKALAATEASTQGSSEASNKRVRLGALPVYVSRARELQWHQAKMNANQIRGARLADTAKLFHAMGALPEKSEN